jgi:hypothetical protein
MYSTPSTGEIAGSGAGDGANIDPAGFADCVAAAHALLDVFLSLDMSVIRALPTLYFVRLTYTVVVLVKLHFAAARLPNPQDAAQKILSLKVDEYLGRMLQKFSGWGTLWPAHRLTKGLRSIRDSFRQCNISQVVASEVSWLDTWTFKRSLIDEFDGPVGAPAEQAIDMGFSGGTQSIEESRHKTFEFQPLKDAEGIPALQPTGQMLPTPGSEDRPWDLGVSILSAMHDELPSMDIGDPLPWDATQFDDWLDTSMNTSTFDFDGDLQSLIQYVK